MIIPRDRHAGRVGAGVPEYIDRVVSLNAEHQPLVRAGLAWLDEQVRRELFAEVSRRWARRSSIAILQPLSDEVDRQQRDALTARYRGGGAGGTLLRAQDREDGDRAAPESAVAGASPISPADLPVRFFRLIKNLTADGYYTSRVGLLEELGYTGNTALAAFPSCTVPEH